MCATNSTVIETELGKFRAQYTKQGLARLQFPRSRIDPIANAIRPSKNLLSLSAKALHSVISGTRPRTLPAFDLSSGTIFQRAVWALLQSIPTGRVETYGTLAYRLNKPKAARAVGGACGANPIPVLIPCHRVIGANGELAGFSSGINWKIKLLRIEGVELPLH